MSENTTANAVATITEQNQVTQQLLMDYLKQTNSNLLPNEQAQFLAISKTFNLNPWKREVYAVAYGSGDKRKLSIIVGYEVYLRRAEEFPQYDGYETEFAGEGANMCCTCKVYRKDRNHPTGATVFLREYTQGNQMWNTKPRVMLEKVAIGTAFRRAFPTEFGGMPYTSEEIRAEDELKAQGYTEVQQAAPVAQPEPPKAAKTQDEKDANWKKMCDEIREKNPEAFDAFLEKVALKSVMDVKTTAGRSKLLADLNEAVKAASATEKETV